MPHGFRLSEWGMAGGAVFGGFWPQCQVRGTAGVGGTYGNETVKSVQSALSDLITTSVPRATFTRFLVEHGFFQYYS